MVDSDAEVEVDSIKFDAGHSRTTTAGRVMQAQHDGAYRYNGQSKKTSSGGYSKQQYAYLEGIDNRRVMGPYSQPHCENKSTSEYYRFL